MSGTEMIIQPTTFRDSSTIATFINIILGLLLGGAIVWFLVVPANRQTVNDEANQQVTDANTKLASESARVQELEDEIDGYLQQVEEANQEQEDADAKVQSYEDLLGIANLYVSGDQSSAASMIAALDAEAFEGNAKTLYESLNGAVQSSLFTEYYNAGTQAYAGGDYTTAQPSFSWRWTRIRTGRTPTMPRRCFTLASPTTIWGIIRQSDSAFNQFSTYYPDRASEVQPYIVGGSSATQQNVTGAEDVSGLGDAATGARTPRERTDPARVRRSRRQIPGIPVRTLRETTL